MIRQWNFEWDQYDEALRTKYFIKTLEPTQICIDWHHQTVAKVIQLITGHGPLDITSVTGTHLIGAQTVDSALRQNKMLYT